MLVKSSCAQLASDRRSWFESFHRETQRICVPTSSRGNQIATRSSTQKLATSNSNKKIPSQFTYFPRIPIVPDDRRNISLVRPSRRSLSSKVTRTIHASRNQRQRRGSIDGRSRHRSNPSTSTSSWEIDAQYFSTGKRCRILSVKSTSDCLRSRDSPATTRSRDPWGVRQKNRGNMTLRVYIYTGENSDRSWGKSHSGASQ